MASLISLAMFVLTFSINELFHKDHRVGFWRLVEDPLAAHTFLVVYAIINMLLFGILTWVHIQTMDVEDLISVYFFAQEITTRKQWTIAYAKQMFYENWQLLAYPTVFLASLATFMGQTFKYDMFMAQNWMPMAFIVYLITLYPLKLAYHRFRNLYLKIFEDCLMNIETNREIIQDQCGKVENCFKSVAVNIEHLQYQEKSLRDIQQFFDRGMSSTIIDSVRIMIPLFGGYIFNIFFL